MDEVAHVTDEWRVARLDLVWNFALPAANYIAAHAAVKVPGIQAVASVSADYRGISWLGSRSRFKLMFYNKSKEMRPPRRRSKGGGFIPWPIPDEATRRRGMG